MGKLFLGQKIREQIVEATELTASIGIGCNKMLAKICSDMNKPNGQTYLQSNETAILEFMDKLPIRKIPGVGKINEQILNGLGIQ